MSNYSLAFFLQDALAGIAVGITVIPQGIAFASVAGDGIPNISNIFILIYRLFLGLEPQYGLYSAFVGPLVYALLGSCKDIAVGPSAIISIMLQVYISDYGADMAVLLSFLAGCIVFIFGILHLGKKFYDVFREFLTLSLFKKVTYLIFMTLLFIKKVLSFY